MLCCCGARPLSLPRCTSMRGGVMHAVDYAQPLAFVGPVAHPRVELDPLQIRRRRVVGPAAAEAVLAAGGGDEQISSDQIRSERIGWDRARGAGVCSARQPPRPCLLRGRARRARRRRARSVQIGAEQSGPENQVGPSWRGGVRADRAWAGTSQVEENVEHCAHMQSAMQFVCREAHL